jgi:hypothetical protein
MAESLNPQGAKAIHTLKYQAEPPAMRNNPSQKNQRYFLFVIGFIKGCLPSIILKVVKMSQFYPEFE